MAAPLIAIVGRLFSKGASGKLAKLALGRELKNMFKGTDVAGGIDIQSHTSAKVKAKGKPVDFPNPLFNSDFFDDLGNNLVNQYRHYIFDKTSPRDAYGKPFKEYSAGYKKSKNTGKMFRQDSSYANSKAPILTGDLLNDFGSHFVVKNNGVELGWASQGAKIEWLKKMGRVLTSKDQPLPKGVIQYIQTQAHTDINKRLGPNKTTTYKIGKK